MRMTEREIIDLINTSLAEEFELDIEDMVAEVSLFDDLELDSLDMVDMVILLEKTFGVKIRDDQNIKKIRTLGDVHKFMIQKVREKEES